MKKILLFTILLSSLNILGQVESQNNTAPFIEVIGTAQKEVTPDRIYISILLTEKTVNNQDFSILVQEEKLKEIIKKNNIDFKNLFLSDAMSEITKNKKKDTGVKLTKEYTLILKNAEEVTTIFEELTDFGIKEMSIKKTEYSDIENARKEVREKAIKIAKEKAQYLLSAIDEQIGKPLEIKEVDNAPFKSMYSNSVIKTDYNSLQNNFEKILIKFSYYIKYSIK